MKTNYKGHSITVIRDCDGYYYAQIGFWPNLGINRTKATTQAGALANAKDWLDFKR